MGEPNIEKMKKGKDVEGLTLALRSYQNAYHVREAAADALGEIGDKRATKHLIQASLDYREWVAEEEGIAESAFRALVKIGDETAIASMKVTRSPKYLCIVNPPLQKIKWPKHCCICLGPAQKFKKTSGTGVLLTQRIWRLGWEGEELETKGLEFTKKVNVPYCQDCYRKLKKKIFGQKEGVKIELFLSSGHFISFETGDPSVEFAESYRLPSSAFTKEIIKGAKIRFRNPQYAKRFLEMNRKPEYKKLKQFALEYQKSFSLPGA